MIKKGLILGLCVVCFHVVIGNQTGKVITLEDIYAKRLFGVKAVNGFVSMKDGETYSTLEGYKDIILWNYKSGKVIDTLLSLHQNDFGIKYIYDYSFNATEDKILFSTNVEPIYRRSFTADYFVFDVKTKVIQALSQNGTQQLAEFSPDGKNIAFFRENNLFIKNLDTKEERQITFDGKKNQIINGAPDWVYEEEFSFNKAYAWSPDGNKIAYMKFDESRVKTFTLTFYNDLYPTLYNYKYPKAGEDNSIVTVQFYDLKTQKTTNADIGPETDQYIPRIKWTEDASKLAIIRLNRLQNKVDILLSNAETGTSSVLFSESNKWFISNVNDTYINFLRDKNHFVIASERDGYSHLYLYDMKGTLVKQLTSGKYDVNDFIGYTPESKTLYYSSSESSPLEKAVYSIKIDGSGKKLLTPLKGTNNAEFNSTFSYFINTCSDANTPPVVTLCDNKGKVLRTLEQNSELLSRIKEFNFNKKEFFQFQNPEGITLMGYMIKPANYDSTKRYPLFMFVYGGPESQEVTNEWDPSVPWLQLLSQKGYIVACVDNRGTDNRGEAFKKSTYMQLGKLETQDQISSARYLYKHYSIDSTKIGMFGWSFGGYMTSSCMTRSNGLFKVGVAVAPVTNWRYYDNIYTERFMRTPQENLKGYDDNSPINYASSLKGKFLLIHGSADDNVHLQNTMEFVEKLVQANKQFDLMIYPDKNHSIYGGNTRLQLYTKITSFITDNL
jgi:dipeptidyl-peptidase-4